MHFFLVCCLEVMSPLDDDVLVVGGNVKLEFMRQIMAGEGKL